MRPFVPVGKKLKLQHAQEPPWTYSNRVRSINHSSLNRGIVLYSLALCLLEKGFRIVFREWSLVPPTCMDRRSKQSSRSRLYVCLTVRRDVTKQASPETHVSFPVEHKIYIKMKLYIYRMHDRKSCPQRSQFSDNSRPLGSLCFHQRRKS